MMPFQYTDLERLEHLKMLLSVIDRMNRCSFQCKTWSVALVAAILAAAASTKPWLAWYAVVPSVVFWALDAYYLWVERGFRNLYTAVRNGDELEAFTMDFPRHMDPDKVPADDYWFVFVSRTVIWVHLTILTGALIVGWLAGVSS